MIEIRKLRKRDSEKARQFAIRGMHLDWYVDNRFFLNLYAGYFWNMELNRATKAYGAYENDAFIGVLLADMKGEKKKYHRVWRTISVRFFDWLQHLAAGKGVDTYDQANREMFRAFCEQYVPDGEIVFLAADPNCGVKGVGTALLSAFEAEEKGKLVYLYTDNACTYQFYEHRGFSKEDQRQVVLELDNKRVPLTCLFYAKRIGAED